MTNAYRIALLRALLQARLITPEEYVRLVS